MAGNTTDDAQSTRVVPPGLVPERVEPDVARGSEQKETKSFRKFSPRTLTDEGRILPSNTIHAMKGKEGRGEREERA